MRLWVTEAEGVVTLSETAAVGVSGPVAKAGLTEVKMSLQGPYVTAGRPLGSAPYTLRTARTRQLTTPLRCVDWWKV